MSDYVCGLLDRLKDVDLQIDYVEGHLDADDSLWHLADLHDERHWLHQDIREFVS